MSLISWEAYDRIDSSMKYLRDAMSYLPHRFGSIHKHHEGMAKSVANLSTDLSQFHYMFDGEPNRAVKDFKDIKRSQRARIQVKKTW